VQGQEAGNLTLPAAVVANQKAAAAAKKGATTTDSRSSSSSSSSNNPNLKRRRPLLLLFPGHISSASLGAHRAVALAERWQRKPHSTHLLLLCPAHLQALPDLLRAAVASDILQRVVLPLLQRLLALEEPSILVLPAGAAGATESAALPVPLPLPPPPQQLQPGDDLQCILSLLSDAQSSGKAEELTNGALDLLSCLDLPRQRQDTASAFSPGSTGCAMSIKEKDVWPPARDLYCETAVASFVRSNMNGCAHGSFRQQAALLLVLVLRFQRRLRGVRLSELFSAASVRTLSFGVGSGSGSSSSGSECEPLSPRQEAAHDSYVAGASASASASASAGADTAALALAQAQREQIESEERVLYEAPRLEFLRQCLEDPLGGAGGAGSAGGSSVVAVWFVYRLAALWRFPEVTVQCLHFPVLIDYGCDAEAREALGTLNGRDSRPFDALVGALRRRVGTAVARVHGVPSCEHALGTLDSEFLAWVLDVADPVNEAVRKSVRETGHALQVFFFCIHVSLAL